MSPRPIKTMPTAKTMVCTRCKRRRPIEEFRKRSEKQHGQAVIERVCVRCIKERARTSQRDKDLRRRYGITMADFAAVARAQGDVCAICGGNRRYWLLVDHDHAKERAGVPIRETVRGLLCRSCNNRLLPAAKDNPEILRRAADYLENPPAHEVLLYPAEDAERGGG